MIEGTFAIYKSKGPTSNGVLNDIRRIAGTRKVGHAGTLDPLATGVLVVAIGREATKKINESVKKEKEYLTTIKLGVISTTDDEEGEKQIFEVKNIPEIKDVEKVIPRFKGKISQIPPIFSAIKVHGKESYKLARKGEAVELASREVEIKEIELLDYAWPYLKLRVVTGPGVYIRSLARDIGKELGPGGYMTELERTRVGDFTKEKALTIEQFRDWVDEELLRSAS